MDGSTTFKVMGGTIAVAGLWTAIVPFVGPTFGYPMPPGADVPAWEWNASHFQRHVLPGVAAILAGLLFWHKGRRVAQTGAWLALAAGVWMIISPFVVRAWLDGMGGGMGGGEPSTVMQIITPLGYHYVPGMLTLGLATLALGLLFAHRVKTPPVEHAVRADGNGGGPPRTRAPEREPVST